MFMMVVGCGKNMPVGNSLNSNPGFGVQGSLSKTFAVYNSVPAFDTIAVTGGSTSVTIVVETVPIDSPSLIRQTQYTINGAVDTTIFVNGYNGFSVKLPLGVNYTISQGVIYSAGGSKTTSLNLAIVAATSVVPIVASRAVLDSSWVINGIRKIRVGYRHDLVAGYTSPWRKGPIWTADSVRISLVRGTTYDYDTFSLPATGLNTWGFIFQSKGLWLQTFSKDSTSLYYGGSNSQYVFGVYDSGNGTLYNYDLSIKLWPKSTTPVANAPGGIKLAGDSTIIYQYDSTKVILNILSGPGTIQYAWGETTAFTTISGTVNFVGWESFTIPKPAMDPLPVLRLSFSGMSSHPAYDATKGDLRFYVQ
jgi:hypothetical protein